MKSLLAVLGLAAVHGTGAAQVNPLEKVLTLLHDLQAKVVADGEVEQKAYEEYVDWCGHGAKDKEWEIKTANAEVEELEAIIDKSSSDAENFAARIEELSAAITQNEAEVKAATEVRQKDEADFIASQSELVDAVDTLDRAISVLEKKMRGSALLQQDIKDRDIQQVLHVLQTVVDAAALNSHDKQRLLALAQSTGDSAEKEDEEADAAALGAPDPDAYKSRSGTIVDVLEDMKEKAENQLSEVRKTEMNSKHNYEMLKQTLTDQLEADKSEFTEAKLGKSEALEKKGKAEGDLAVTKKDLADAQKVLGSMHVDCMNNAQDHEASVKSRADEVKVLDEAIKIIQSTTSGAAGATYNFLQLSSINNKATSASVIAGSDLVSLLRRLAHSEQSPELAQLASRVGNVLRYGEESGQDPFAKVKQMIQDMIVRLEKDGADEASHKAYCDTEMGKTKKKREELTYDVETLSAKIDRAKTDSTKLKEEVAELQKELAEIAKNQADADKIRVDEKAAYVETKADLEQGLSGVRQALKVLKDYYAEKEKDAALLQGKTKQPAKPVTHSASDGGAGIIGMLEVIESDFSKNLAQIQTQEDSAFVEYQKVIMTNKVSKTMKEGDVKYKTKEAAVLDKAVADLGNDLEGAQSELDALLKYTSNLRGMCELKPETYADRKDRRNAEIKGLKEALAVLDGEAVFLQGNKRGKRPTPKGLRGHH